MIHIRKFGICFLLCFLFAIETLTAQHWISFFPSGGMPINDISILKPGNVVIGGGGFQNGNSLQIMLSSFDYGNTWTENPNDGFAEQNESNAFADSLNGLGVGLGGRIISTVDGGLSWGNPLYPFIRDWKKIINVPPLSYYAVGGINDSIQTVFKTIDGGGHWSIARDTAGQGLNAVFFNSALSGCAVGDSGTIITTIDGGITWSIINSPVIRNFYGVTFINVDTGYIVGGLRGPNGKKTILKTINGGASWTVLQDQPGACLNDVSFGDSLNGYIVGDSAAVLQTTDGGLTWATISIPASSNLESLTSVKFYSAGFGAVGAFDGFVFVYTNFPAPQIQNERVIFNGSDSINLSAVVNTKGAPDSVKFIYSTTRDLHSPSATTTVLLSNNALQTVGANITDIATLPGTYYFTCRVSNKDSVYDGDTLSFIISHNLPQLLTLAGTGVTPNSITLRGEVDFLPVPSSVFFEYQSGYDTAVIALASIPSAINDTLYHVVSAPVAGLLPYTTYRVRLKATSGNSVMYGNYNQFTTTTGTTVVTTLPATGVSGSLATLQGQVGYLPFSANIRFQYSLLGGANIQTVAATPVTISDTSFHYVSAQLTGLAPNTYYQYQLQATNFIHTLNGGFQYFYNGSPQIIVADPASNIGYYAATLNGHISNLHFPANLKFCYSQVNSSASTLNCITPTPASVSDTASYTVTIGVNSLRPFTQYNYTLYALDLPLQLQSVNPASFYTGPGFHNSLVLTTKPASHVSSFSATLNAVEENLPDTGILSFDFWEAGQNSSEISIAQGSINDSLLHDVSAVVTGLSPNTLYMYRIKLSGNFGTVYGDSMSFYNGPNSIPNFDFENWTTVNGIAPVGWYNVFGPLQQVTPGANGTSHAIRLQTTNVGMDQLNNQIVPTQGNGVNQGNGLISITGGVPYAARPDTFSGMFQYDILSGDTGFIVFGFKSAGQFLSLQFNPVTGSSGGVFKKLSFPVVYNSAAIPDSLLIAFAPTNFFTDFPIPGSSMVVDELTFGPSFPAIPNGNFENWVPYSYKKPDGWSGLVMPDFGWFEHLDSECINRTSDAWHGNYAAELTTRFSLGSEVNGTSMSTQSVATQSEIHHADFRINHRPAMFSGYFKFLPNGDDTLSFDCGFYKNGIRVGGAYFITEELTPDYTFFSAPCYFNDNPTIIPDSARIEIRTFANNTIGPSTVVIDYLAFDGYLPDTVLALNNLNTDAALHLYPNPAADHLIVSYVIENPEKGSIKIYNIIGEVIREIPVDALPGVNTRDLDLSGISSGVYLVSVRLGAAAINGKFILQH